MGGALYSHVVARTWDSVRQLQSHMFGDWIYRGHEVHDWQLASTIERALSYSGVRDNGVAADLEAWTLRELRRNGQNYGVRLPQTDRELDWLALLQHHGGTTRLLDFTRSLFVAAFFAYERPVACNRSVWCINRTAVLRGAFKQLRPNGDVDSDLQERSPYADAMERSFLDAEIPALFDCSRNDVPLCVLPVQPEFSNERIYAQQGLFLIPSRLDRPFADALAKTLGAEKWSDLRRNSLHLDAINPKAREYVEVVRSAIIQIELPVDARCACLDELAAMNINAATLFPGFDGFARSLRSLVERRGLSAETIERLWRISDRAEAWHL